MNEVTVEYPSSRQPATIKIINRVGRLLGGIGVTLPDLSSDSLLQKAVKTTGLKDFGEESFRPALDRLVEALKHEAKLSQIGRIAASGRLLDELSTRLQLIEYRKQRPEVARQQIVRPLFVLGLPRTGTTILYELLAQDSRHRAPMSWEVSKPVPPAQRETFTSDPRIEEVEKSMAALEMLAPGFKAIHEIGAQLPQECLSLLSSHFISDQYGATFYIPEYRRWSLDQDMTAAYRWHYQFLQHLQVDFSAERWVLKTPAHLPYLDTIIAQYPDAVFVQTHRQPMDVMGSISSLACTLHSAFSDDIDPLETGQSEVQHFSKVLERGMKQRDAMSDSGKRFYDIQFAAIISDPIGAIEKMYEHFGFDFTGETRQSMQNYIDSRPRNKHGKHEYTLEQFGLSQARHGVFFDTYCKRFGL